MSANDITKSGKSGDLTCAWGMYKLYAAHDAYGSSSRTGLAESGLVQTNQNRPAAAAVLSAHDKGVKL